ncbi:hypothetical protein [Gemmobacter sp.]|uniref:hypothetical protein n=1 Tax=Gemmobacter sp. TaxID=1898957 RepID=UPI002AFEA9BA|nr:hypothetical protein [Gemmobacter sp.]
MPRQRLRSVDEQRLIDRPLSVRRGVIRLSRRRPPGLLVWVAALLTVVAVFALPA